MKNAANKTIEQYFAEADVHDVAREKNGGLMTCAVALVVLLVESILVYWAVYSNLAVPMVLLAHFVVSALLAIYARILRSTGRENRFAYLLFLATATSGPFGAGGVVITTVLYFIYINRSATFEEWFESIFPSVQVGPSEQVYSDLVVGRDESSRTYSVISFLDVLSFGNEAQKRQALAKMTSNFHPSFAPAFKKALNSDSNSIRVQAATAISKIETQFTERLMKIAKIKEQFPNEPVVVKALAEHYDNYAYTGLLDSDREQNNRQKAYTHFMEYLQLVTADVDVRTRVGRLLMREGEYSKACDWFQKCIQLGYNSDTISQWYSEALFKCGKYEELRRFSLHLKNIGQSEATAQPVSVREALGLWQTAEGRI